MLRVTKLTDYATVVLTVLAARPGEVLSATELAEFTGLEPPTVSKVLKPLAQAGLVEGLRGVRGGYRLTRPAIEISLIEVVEAMEGPLALTECSRPPPVRHGAQCGAQQLAADQRRGLRGPARCHPRADAAPSPLADDEQRRTIASTSSPDP
jgi:FeS assembly SUF system regulator